MTQEIWKDIPGYEGQYQVSNLGRVKGNDRWITYKNGKGRKQPGKIISQHNVSKDYKYKKVMLVDTDNNKHYVYVHRCVAAAFIPNPDNLPEVNHKNQIHDDNRLENLEWISSKGNINYADRVQRMVATRLYHNRLKKVKNHIERKIIEYMYLWRI